MRLFFIAFGFSFLIRVWEPLIRRQPIDHACDREQEAILWRSALRR